MIHSDLIISFYDITHPANHLSANQHQSWCPGTENGPARFPLGFFPGLDQLQLRVPSEHVPPAGHWAGLNKLINVS